MRRKHRYPARQHLDYAVGARRGDAVVEHLRRELEAEEPDAAQRACERAGPGPRQDIGLLKHAQDVVQAVDQHLAVHHRCLAISASVPVMLSSRPAALATSRSRLAVQVTDESPIDPPPPNLTYVLVLLSDSKI